MSSRALLDHKDDVIRFVDNIRGTPGDFDPCWTLGFLDTEGTLEAGLIFHNYHKAFGTIEISAASTHRGWGTLERLRMIFWYPFDFLGCQMVVARTSEKNTTGPLRIWKALGADFYPIPRLYGRDHAAIITTLTVEQWKASRFHGRS